MSSLSKSINLEEAVRKRYSRGARSSEPSLCCSVNYNPKYLSVILKAVLNHDYGCGDPSKHLRPGETVLDLGCGTGKICFIAAQIVGPSGRVVGVDINDQMLNVARKATRMVVKRIGYDNVSFLKGRIQDLRLDMEWLEKRLAKRPLSSSAHLRSFEGEMTAQRFEKPLVADGSIDVVVSNCVLNLVPPEDKGAMFSEIFRVLKPGGRAVISDIVSDEEVPLHMQQDPELWSGCISGALQESQFIASFERAGFHGVTVLSEFTEPWRVMEGIEFRSTTVAAYKDAMQPSMEHYQAVVYKGPFARVEDEMGHVYPRGVRTAVGDSTFKRLLREPYEDLFDYIEPAVPVEPDDAELFPCGTEHRVRDPHFTKWGGKSSSFSAAICHAPAAGRISAVCCSSPPSKEESIPTSAPSFEDAIAGAGLEPLSRNQVTTLQINLGRLCNQSCIHCFMDAGPGSTEVMERDTYEQVLDFIDENPRVGVVELTGGSPELSPHFRPLVQQLEKMNKKIIDRCNLTVLARPGMEEMADFLASYRVEVVASLPHYAPEDVDDVRGRGVFESSIEALRRLTELGYGKGNPDLPLNLVYNPVGTLLPIPKQELEENYRRELGEKHGIGFDRLLTLTNIPIGRFAARLKREGRLDWYVSLLAINFNAENVKELMCRSLVTVDWKGRLYDCNFNLAVDLPLRHPRNGQIVTLSNAPPLSDLEGASIATDNHCFGCTAGSGSGCFGVLHRRTPVHLVPGFAD